MFTLLDFAFGPVSVHMGLLLSQPNGKSLSVTCSFGAESSLSHNAQRVADQREQSTSGFTQFTGGGGDIVQGDARH